MNRYYRIFIINTSLLLLLCSATVIADDKQIIETNVNPGINNYYYDADFEQWRSTFESTGREVFDQQATILQSLSIKPGMDIADIGAGTGLYTIPFAQQVGNKGTVYAVDISEPFVRNIELRAKENNLDNVSGIVNNQKSTNLPVNSIDLAFICNTYHHFEYPQTTLNSIYKALRSDGKLNIIDYRKVQGISSNWVMRHVRIDKNAVIKEVESNNFILIEDKNILHSNYYLTFRKKN